MPSPPHRTSRRKQIRLAIRLRHAGIRKHPGWRQTDAARDCVAIDPVILIRLLKPHMHCAERTHGIWQTTAQHVIAVNGNRDGSKNGRDDHRDHQLDESTTGLAETNHTSNHAAIKQQELVQIQLNMHQLLVRCWKLITHVR